MRVFSVLTLSLLLLSCSKESEQHEISRGFYHWKTDFDISKDQDIFLNKLDANVLYIKYFDVVQGSTEYSPEAIVRFKSETSLEIVPTIYITTEVFTEIDSVGIPELAERIATMILDIHGDRPDFKEVQFDCDWAASIQDKYFYFLEEVQTHFPAVTISATVRLYQYKYPEICGVPPVDKGLLMYYNMGGILDYHESNSILNNEQGSQYLGFGEYPLPIDIALPNFEWCLLFRSGNFERICPNFSKDQLSNNELFAHKADNWYIFQKDTVIDDTYFRFGDELRHEYCSEKELLVAARLLTEEMNQENVRILIYDLQPNTIQDYEKLDAVFRTFD